MERVDKFNKLTNLRLSVLNTLSDIVEMELDKELTINTINERKGEYSITDSDNELLVEIKNGLVYDFTGGYGSDTISRPTRKAIVGLLDSLQVITTQIGYVLIEDIARKEIIKDINGYYN